MINILPISSEALVLLSDVARSVKGVAAEIASDWATSFRANRNTFDDRDIRNEVFEDWVDLYLSSLADGDLNAYFARLQKRGRDFARESVPYEHLILSFHLFEDASAPYLQKLFGPRFPKVISTLDHLYHNVIAVLAREYFAELERQREKVVHVLAHDLRIPLTAMLLTVEALDRGAIPPGRQKESLARVLRSGKLMTDLIERMLEYGKLRSGKFKPNFVEIDLAKLLRESVGIVREGALARNLTLKINGEAADDLKIPQPVFIKGDQSLIARAINNYLSNALKHARTSVSVVLRDEGSFVTILVQDDGLGVPPEQAPAIFDDYYVVPGGTAGAGLGLPSVLMIARLHGGQCGLNPQIKGAEFFLKLPKG